VLCHESFELGDDLRVATELELGLDQLLVGGRAELLETSDLDARERFEGEIGQGRPPPETERLAQEICAPLGIAALRRLRDEPLESAQIDLLRRNVEDVAGLARLEDVAPERLPHV